MWGNHGWGWGWPVVLVMAVAMVACMAMMTGMMRHGSWRRMWPPGNRDEDEDTPERILAGRLARGEIGVEEFQRRRDGLQHASNSTADSNATAGTAQPGYAERHSPP